MSKSLSDQMKASFAKASGHKADINRSTGTKKMDAPKTHKAKSNIGTEYKADPNRPRAKK